MNVVQLYKRLPQKQCRECRQKTCMPFALALIRGEAELSECPHLTREELADLSAVLKRSDWREELIGKLRHEIREIPFQKVAEGIGGELRGGSLVLRCLGRDFTVSPHGEITSLGHITPWMKILLLHYIRTAGEGPLSGQWVSFSDLKGGMVKIAALERECEAPLRELFEKGYAQTVERLTALGAEQTGEFATPHAWLLSLLPRIPVAILFWAAEEEFSPTVKLLFDRSADRFLDVETLIFLSEGLVRHLETRPHP